ECDAAGNWRQPRGRGRLVSAYAGICACGRLHQPKKDNEGYRHERQRCRRCDEQNRIEDGIAEPAPWWMTSRSRTRVSTCRYKRALAWALSRELDRRLAGAGREGWKEAAIIGIAKANG